MLCEEFAEGETQTLAARRYLSGVVEFDIVLELARFTNTGALWPDCIGKHEILSHLKRLEGFFLYDSNRTFSRSSLKKVTAILGDFSLLAECSGSWPRAITFATRRKNLWSELSRMVDIFLISHYAHGERDAAYT